MDQRWLEGLIAEMRAIGNDTSTCEVKAAKGGLPASVVETLSAFSNGVGGHLILGVSERDGFTPVKDFDARAMQDALSSACERLTPVVRPEISVIPLEGTPVVCARVHEMRQRDKPCYITARRVYDGSFIRTGDGDRRMTPYEVERLLEERTQPRHDDVIVPEATLADLDAELTGGFVRRQRELHPRILGARGTEDILLRLHVARRDEDGELRPTVAGLMAMGSFPQEFFPRLNVTFTAYPGVDKIERAGRGRRFLDNQSIIGPIPVMIEEALAAVARNTRTGAIIEGALRRDVPDYPPVAVREAVANALMHRDYSPESQGSQVQVNLYADRLEVLNPGGLYGNVTIDTLGEAGVSSSRNQYLSNILETTPFPGGGYVVENRGTGYREIEEQLSQAMMAPPRPRSSTVEFSLTIDKRRLGPSETGGASALGLDDAILAYLGERSSASTRELVEASGLARSTVTAHVRGLVDKGLLEPTEPGRSPKQRYRLKRD